MTQTRAKFYEKLFFYFYRNAIICSKWKLILWGLNCLRIFFFVFFCLLLYLDTVMCADFVRTMARRPYVSFLIWSEFRIKIDRWFYYLFFLSVLWKLLLHSWVHFNFGVLQIFEFLNLFKPLNVSSSLTLTIGQSLSYCPKLLVRMGSVCLSCDLWSQLLSRVATAHSGHCRLSCDALLLKQTHTQG